MGLLAYPTTIGTSARMLKLWSIVKESFRLHKRNTQAPASFIVGGFFFEKLFPLSFST